MAGRFSIEARFKAVDKMTAPISRMEKKIRRFTKSMEKGLKRVNKAVKKISGGFKKAAVGITAGIVGIGAAMRDIILIGSEFGRAIGAAAAKFPEGIKRGTKEFKALEFAARAVGKATEFTATQAARGLNFLAKAGFSAKFSIKALPEIIDFATASEIDFATAADIASDALGSFGLDSENLEKKMKGLKRVMDVMGLTANSTNVTVAELFESIKDGGPIAESAGQTIETFAATMGFLANSGIKATKAGTAAKNIILGLAGVGNKADKVFKALNISLADENGQLRDQFDVLDELRKKLSKFGQKQRITLIEAIFGKIPIAAATKLLNSNGKAVRKLRKELEQAGGSNKRIAEFIRNDVKGSLDSLRSAIEGVKISIFTMNKGPLKEMIDNLTVWIRTNEKLIATKITDFIINMSKSFDSVVKKGKKILIVIGVILSLIAVLKILIVIMTAVNLVMAMNPVVLAIIAMIAVIGIAVYWWSKLREVYLSIPEPLRIIMKALLLFLGPIGLLILAADLIISNWEPLKKFFVDLWDGILNVFDESMKKITGVIDKIKNVASDITGKISDIGSKTLDLFDFGDDGEENKKQEMISNNIFKGDVSPKVISPQERILRSIEEQRTTNTSEITIKDESGRAEITKGRLSNGLKLINTGAF
jgi:TP901 family phage tail tape measure protein